MQWNLDDLYLTMDREELNRVAHLLAERASGLKSRQSTTEQLREECCQLRAELEKLRERCSRLPPVPAVEKGSYLDLLLQQRQLQAEIQVRKEHVPQPNGIDTSKVEEVVMEQLDTTMKLVKHEKEAASRELEREKQYLEETRLLAETLARKVSDVKSEEKVTSRSKSPQPDGKWQVMTEALIEYLESFVEGKLNDLQRKKHKKTKDGMKQTTLTPATPTNQVSLCQFIKELIDKALDTPHNPYLPVGGVSEDHFLFLLRSGVVQRHPQQPSLVKVTSFHH